MRYILVFDDQKINRDILVRRLSKKGYNVLETENVPNTLSMIEKEDTDLILLDTRMPEIDGNEIFEVIRKTHSAIDLPVIMVTVENDSETKPINFPVLLART